MHRAGKFIFQDAIHLPLAIHPAAIGECRRDDFYPKMGLTFGTGPDVTGVKM